MTVNYLTTIKGIHIALQRPPNRR